MDLYTLDTSSLSTDQREDLLIRCRDNLKVLNRQLDEERELRRLAEKEVQNLRFELIYFEERLIEYEAKQNANSSDITVYEQENKDLKKELHFLNRQLREANHDKDMEKARAEDLTEELENLQKLFEESKNELEQKQASFDDWQMTLQAVEIQLRTLSDENRNLTEDVKRYKVQYDTILEQTHALQNTVQLLKEENHILEEENHNIQDRLSYSDISILHQKNTMQQEIQKALEKIKAAHTEQEALWREEISSSVKKLQSQVDESKLNFSNAEKDRSYLQDKLYKLKEKKKNLLNVSMIEKQTLENELEQLRSEIDAHRNMLKSQNGFKDTVKSLESQLHESRIENEKTLGREKNLNEQCTYSYNEIQNLKNEVREKETTIQRFEQRLSELQQKLRNIQVKHENEINEHRKAFNKLAKEYEQEKIKAKLDTARTLQNNRFQEELEKFKQENSQLKLSYQSLQSKRNEEIQNLHKDRERLQSLVIELQKQLESAGTEIRQMYNEKPRRSISYTDQDISDSFDTQFKRLTKENCSLKEDLTSKSEELESKESDLIRLKDSFKKRLQTRIFECESKVSKWREKFLEELGYIQRWMETLKQDRSASGIMDKVEGMLSRLDTVLSCTYNIEY